MVPGQFMCLPQFFEYPTNGNVTGVSRLILPLIRTIAAAGLLAGCAAPGPVVTSLGGNITATGGGGQFSTALDAAQRYCIPYGPSFSGSASAILAAGGQEIPELSGKRAFAVPSGVNILVRTSGPVPQCTVQRAPTGRPEAMLAVLGAQPNLRQVPGVHEQILIDGRSVAFPHLWEVPNRGLVLVVTPGMIITQRYVASEHQPARNGQTAIVPID